MIGTYNKNIKNKMQSGMDSLNSQVRSIQSGIKSSITRQKNKMKQEYTAISEKGSKIPMGGTKVETHKKFKDVIERGRNNPVAQKVYNHFSKYGDEIAKRAMVVSGLESNWKESTAADTNIERSFGPFQINLNAHNARVAKYSGTKDINSNAKWLQNIDNSLIIADEIYKEQGFKPWTVARKSVKTPLGILGNNIMDL